MRLAVRMIIAVVITMFAAVVLYFVFLHGERPDRDEVQPMNNHIGSSPASAVEGLRHLARVGG